MLTVAPVSVLLLGVIGMLVVAFSVARMAAAERRYRGPVTTRPRPPDRAADPAARPARLKLRCAAAARSSAGTTSAAPTRGW